MGIDTTVQANLCTLQTNGVKSQMSLLPSSFYYLYRYFQPVSKDAQLNARWHIMLTGGVDFRLKLKNESMQARVLVWLDVIWLYIAEENDLTSALDWVSFSQTAPLSFAAATN